MRALLLTVLLLAGVLLSGCLNIEPGMQLPGQECRSTADCVDGLLCVERRCRPVGGQALPDAGHLDADENQLETDAHRPDVDGPDECNAQEAECLDDFTARVCRNGQWQVQPCEDSERCLNGACFASMDCAPGEAECLSQSERRFCNDVGQWVQVSCSPEFGFSCLDGYCQAPNANCGDTDFFCLDRRTGVSCVDGTWVDDLYCPVGSSCSEGDQDCVQDPEPTCCPGGCGAGEICDGCQCKPYDLSVCQFQDQPCSVEGQFANGFSCLSITGTDSLRCYGICTTGVANPDATCPGTDPALCNFEPGDPNGICFSWCGEGQPCADSRQRCVYSDGGPLQGVCWPTTGTGTAGQACDPFDVFSCAGSALCIEGTCQDTCRPFYGGPTDCTAGHCLPFGETIGICAPDSSTPGGGCATESTTCGRDASGCFQDFQTMNLICYDFCRLSQGANDCAAGQICFDFGEGDLGICWSF